MIKKRLGVTLRLSDDSTLPIRFVPEGRAELKQSDLTVLRRMMIKRLSGVIAKGGLLGVSDTHFVNTAHIVRVVVDDEVEEY